MQRYLIVIEPTPTGFSAYSPDFPGCMGTGHAREDVERAMQGTLVFHLDGLRVDGEPVPPPTTSATYVEVAA
jgi:predicted RNase H-like HicB family nuclease